MPNVTMREWATLLAEALSDCELLARVTTGGSEGSEAWISAHLSSVVDVSIRLAIAPSPRGALLPEVRVGSSSALPSNLTAARAHLDAARAVVSCAERAYARLYRYTVWPENAPCDACGGTGRVRHNDHPCASCDGLGVRNDPPAGETTVMKEIGNE